MPGRKVSFSQLFAFGAGVAVGANWPRASNIVGFILQRLGFELTDLAIWMWDPEKSNLRSQEDPAVVRLNGKKENQVPRIQTGGRPKKKARAKKETAQFLRIESDPGIGRAMRRKAPSGRQAWIRPDRIDGRATHPKGLGDSPSTQSANPERRTARTRTGDRKPKGGAAKNQRGRAAARRGARIRAFPPAVSPAAAALN